MIYLNSAKKQKYFHFKNTKCPSADEWINKLWYIYTMEYYLAIKNKKVILPFAIPWMGLKSIILREISRAEKDKYYMISLMWNLMSTTN